MEANRKGLLTREKKQSCWRGGGQEDGLNVWWALEDGLTVWWAHHL